MVSEYSAPTTILSMASKKRHAWSRGAQALNVIAAFSFWVPDGTSPTFERQR